MVKISDLLYLIQKYPFGSVDDPLYVFAGGTAVQCLLHDSMYQREYHDIDLSAFDSRFLKSIQKSRNDKTTFFYNASLTIDGIIPYYCKYPIELQIIQGSYYDAEITPNMGDVRSKSISKNLISLLSPEFIIVSKLSYPNVHRLQDFRDILALI